MQRLAVRLLIIFFVIVVAIIGAVFLSLVLAPYGYPSRDVYAVIVLLGGIVVSRELAVTITDILRPRLRNDALVVGNAASICGFIISALAAASFAAISSTTILASAAVGGLVLGLALQSTLGSFFRRTTYLGIGRRSSGHSGEDS